MEFKMNEVEIEEIEVLEESDTPIGANSGGFFCGARTSCGVACGWGCFGFGCL